LTGRPSEAIDYEALSRLEGRRFLVIGGGQGIGRETCRCLAQYGAEVICADKDPVRAAQVAEEVGGVACSGDATNRAELEQLFAAATAAPPVGPLHGVVDIVGGALRRSLLELGDADWDAQMDLNLRHVFFALQVGARTLAPSGGGSMVFISSVSGLTAANGHAAYGAAKGGVVALVRSAAVELAPQGIRVNAVAPGAIWSERIASVVTEADRREAADGVPLGRLGAAADVAGAVLFLVSDLAGYVTGQTLVVDGGVGVKFPYAEYSRARRS
jgi:NAD(P)-dependent dehydrogenase (short-subunit alcohol dehydrogenase family)